MSSRCRSWSYRGHAPGFELSKHQGHLPGGKCRVCWRPCRNRLSAEERQRGATRCDECVSALLYHPDAAIRRALLDEPGLERSVLVALSTDASGAIALAASRRLEEADATVQAEPGDFDLPPSRYDGSRPQPSPARASTDHPKDRSHL